MVLIPNLFLSKLLNLATLYDYFLYPVCFTTVTECVSSNWIEVLMETET